MSAGAQLRDLEAACARITADGTDAAVLARVVGWAVRPRRSLDALRRRCRDASRPLGLSDAIGDVVSVGDVAAARPLVERWAELRVRVALVGDHAYPTRLAEGWPHLDGPVLLAWRGASPPAGPSVALVGSRRASGYGTAVTAWLAEAASHAGVRVLSGGAVGIDAAAHEAALAGRGGTTVVLGCGHAFDYPRPHARPGGLFDRVLEAGGTLASELLPFEPPRAGQVRARNRIVAALADVVVVVEGREGSGALLTAASAADRGRLVLAVPGDVRAPGSAAPHRLLVEGAGPCTGPEDLLAALGGTLGRREGSDDGAIVGADDRAGSERHEPGGTSAGGASSPTLLPGEVHAKLATAWPRPVTTDELAAEAGCAVPSLLASLTRARMAGEVVESAEGVRLRRAPR